MSSRLNRRRFLAGACGGVAAGPLASYGRCQEVQGGKGESRFFDVSDQLVSRRYEVKIDGRSVPVYRAALDIHVVSFDVTGPVEITVTAREPDYWNKGVDIRPLATDTVGSVSGRTVTFELSEPAMLTGDG